MQWLIDLIIEAIGIPPVFIDRGDPFLPDFAIGDLTLDATWHELDLSAIVPEGASCVALNIAVFNNFINKSFEVRTLGKVNHYNLGGVITQVANLANMGDVQVHPDSDRKIEYLATAGGWFVVNITVKGWWL